MQHREHSGTPEQATADHRVAGIDFRLEKFGSDWRSSARVCIAIPHEKPSGGMPAPGMHKCPLNGCRAGAGTDLHPEYRVRRLVGDGDGD